MDGRLDGTHFGTRVAGGYGAPMMTPAMPMVTGQCFFAEEEWWFWVKNLKSSFRCSPWCNLWCNPWCRICTWPLVPLLYLLLHHSSMPIMRFPDNRSFSVPLSLVAMMPTMGMPQVTIHMATFNIHRGKVRYKVLKEKWDICIYKQSWVISRYMITNENKHEWLNTKHEWFSLQMGMVAPMGMGTGCYKCRGTGTTLSLLYKDSDAAASCHHPDTGYKMSKRGFQKPCNCLKKLHKRHKYFRGYWRVSGTISYCTCTWRALWLRSFPWVHFFFRKVHS